MSDFKVRPNADEMTLSGLEPAEISELREWFCYTKPLSRSIRIMASPTPDRSGFGIVSAGNEWGPAEEIVSRD